MSATARSDASGIDVRLPNGKQTVLRLRSKGIRTATDCRFFADRLTRLISAINLGTTPPLEIQNWLKNLPDPIYEKLRKLGLVQRRMNDQVFCDYLANFLDDHAKGKSPGTVKVLNRARKHAVNYFGNLRVSEIDVQSARGFRKHLLGLRGKQGGSFAEATARKACGVVSMCLNHAIAEGIISANPFKLGKVPTSAGRNAKREAYVSESDIDKVIVALGTTEDAVLFALSRYGALRIPSEIVELRWTDIDWARREMMVVSPKTASTGKVSRVVPIFPKLFRVLESAYPKRDQNSEFILPQLRCHSNLNVRLRRSIAAAGVPAYPKVTHNLRASCITDWIAQGHSPADVAEWAGHSPKVLFDHYIRKRGTGIASRAALAAAKIDGAVDGGFAETSDESLTAPPAVNRVHGRSRATEVPVTASDRETGDHRRHFVATGDQTSASKKVDLIGLEPTTSSMPWKRSPN